MWAFLFYTMYDLKQISLKLKDEMINKWQIILQLFKTLPNSIIALGMCLY